MFVMGCYGHRLSNGVLFAYHLILDAPGGSSHLGYRRRVPIWHNPTTRVKYLSSKNYSADFYETLGIDWNLFRASNDIPGTRGSDGNIPN